MEGDAQVQAAVAAGGGPPPATSKEPMHFNPWSLKFSNAGLEVAYCRKVNTNCDNYDYIPVIFKLVLSMPHVLQIFKEMRTRVDWEWTAAVPPGQPVISAGQLWHMCVAGLCVVFLAIQLGASKWYVGGTGIPPMFSLLNQPMRPWYRSHRGRTLWWVVFALWVCESIKLHFNTSVWGTYVMEVVASCICMSFIHLVPFSLHLQLRMYGCGCQLAGVLARHDRVGMGLLVPGVVGGHLVGAFISYFLDQQARSGFLKSFPHWLPYQVSRNSTLLQSFRSYSASLSRNLRSIFYPGPIDLPHSEKGGVSVFQGGVPGWNQAVTRRALGGFAGGFGGVSGLKCALTSSSFAQAPISSWSNSSFDWGGWSDSSSSGGQLWVTQYNQAGARGPLRQGSQGTVRPSVELEASSACSQVHSTLQTQRQCASSDPEDADSW